MYYCAASLGSRAVTELHEVTGVEPMDGGCYAVALDGVGMVVSSSSSAYGPGPGDMCAYRPRPGDMCAYRRIGTHLLWEFPLVELTRMASGGGLFDDGGLAHGTAGSMVGVVEGVRPGYVSVGGKEYRCDSSPVVGSRISYDFGPDGELRVISVVEGAVAQSPGPGTLTAALRVRGPGVRQAADIGPEDPRSSYGVMVVRTGDVFEIRVAGRSGRKLGKTSGSLEGVRFEKRLKALGGIFSDEDGEWVWRIDMSKPFSGSKENGWLGLVHLAGWIKDPEGKLPGIFGDLRDWVSGRRPVSPDGGAQVRSGN